MCLHRFEENSKFGYRDEDGTIAILAKYDDAKEFKENLAIVKYNGFYGVINSSDIVVIDFIYSTIEENKLFFECKETLENDSITKSLWYNRDGVVLHEGKATALSENLLCISNGKKFGVISQDGNRIINCLYDEIVLSNELLIVLRGDTLGLYDLSGNVILDAFCHSIESVVIENNSMLLGRTTFSEKRDSNQYPGYCKEFYFDTDNNSHTISPYIHFHCGTKKDLLYREAIMATSKWKVYNVNQSYNPEYFIETIKTIKDITKPMIISTGTIKMIFTKSEGILPNSEFDDIQQIAQICCVVKKDNLYGVYRIDTKSLVIPIEYESIRFYGGHTVLLCKDGLWGAKDIMLDNPIYTAYKVSIPTDYLEIKILDDLQQYYGCKIEDEWHENAYYSIIKSNSEEIDFGRHINFNSQFDYFGPELILTSEDGKYGFVSINGYVSIPFKYEEIRIRKDGKFDVRIGDRWGLLTSEGYEIVPVLYTLPMPHKLNNGIIVQDADSYCFGVINKDGVRTVPCIYEHLFESEDEQLFFYIYDGYPDTFRELRDYESFFEYSSGKCGVVNVNGKQIVDAKYAYIRIYSNFILAGRDGTTYKTYPSDAVYDLYTKEGELLIGGFKEVIYNEAHELFFFFFGGDFECGGEHNVWGDFDEHESWDYYEKFDRGIDKWLILDKDLKTILRDEKGERFQFPKGFIGKVEIKKEGKKKTYVYNMPLKYFVTVHHDPEHLRFCNMSDIISNNSIIIKYGTQAIDIASGKTTKEFSHIEQITDKLFLYKDADTVGITNIDSDILIGNCFLITRPVSNYIFIAMEKSVNECCLWLYDINNITTPITLAISNIDKKNLISFAERENLKMEFDKNHSGLKSIVLQTSDIFDEDFVSKVTVVEKGKPYSSFYHNTSYFIRGNIPSNA